MEENKMRDNYDFSNGIKNPYADRLKKQITILTGTMSTGSGSLPGSCPNCHKMVRLVVQNGNLVGTKPA